MPSVPAIRISVGSACLTVAAVLVMAALCLYSSTTAGRSKTQAVSNESVPAALTPMFEEYDQCVNQTADDYGVSFEYTTDWVSGFYQRHGNATSPEIKNLLATRQRLIWLAGSEIVSKFEKQISRRNIANVMDFDAYPRMRYYNNVIDFGY